MLISPSYRAMNEAMHANPDYGNSGRLFGKVVRGILQADPGIKTALDYGCGKGTLKAVVPGVEWREYDPAVPEKNAYPLPADLVCCTEVLEHVEPECLDAVLDDLRRLTIRCCFISVEFCPALKVLPDGRNAHLIQKPERWWDKRLRKRFTLVHYEQRQSNDGMMVLGFPRK